MAAGLAGGAAWPVELWRWLALFALATTAAYLYVDRRRPPMIVSSTMLWALLTFQAARLRTPVGQESAIKSYPLLQLWALFMTLLGVLALALWLTADAEDSDRPAVDEQPGFRR